MIVAVVALMLFGVADASFAKVAGKSKKAKKPAKSSTGGFGAKAAVAAGPTAAQQVSASSSANLTQGRSARDHPRRVFSCPCTALLTCTFLRPCARLLVSVMPDVAARS